MSPAAHQEGTRALPLHADFIATCRACGTEVMVERYGAWSDFALYDRSPSGKITPHECHPVYAPDADVIERWLADALGVEELDANERDVARYIADLRARLASSLQSPDSRSLASEIRETPATNDDTARLDLLQAGGEPEPILEFFVGDGGGSQKFQGETWREAIDKARVQFGDIPASSLRTPPETAEGVGAPEIEQRIGEIERLEIERLGPDDADVQRLLTQLRAARSALGATQAELGAWRWLHWGKTDAWWACACGDARGSGMTEPCATCGTPRPAKGVPTDYGFTPSPAPVSAPPVLLGEEDRAGMLATLATLMEIVGNAVPVRPNDATCRSYNIPAVTDVELRRLRSLVTLLQDGGTPAQQVHGVTWVLIRDGYVALERCPKKAKVLGVGEWFVPGGKLEPGETPAQALCREMREEWPSIELLTGSPLPILAGSPIPPGPRGLFLMQPYDVLVRGDLPAVSADGVELRWVPISEALASPVPQVRMMVSAALLAHTPEGGLGGREGAVRSPEIERLGAMIKSAQRIIDDAEATHESMGRFDLEPPNGPGGSLALHALTKILPEVRALIAVASPHPDSVRLEAVLDAAPAGAEPRRRECSCPAWQDQLPLINGPITLQQIRSGKPVSADRYIPWNCCPWCGTDLRIARTDEPPVAWSALSVEQQARDLLERIGVEDAQRFSSGDLVELANLIARAGRP